MVEMRLFRSRAFSGGTVTMMLWAFGIFGIYFFTSIYLQDILGFSPTKAGPGVRPDGAVPGRCPPSSPGRSTPRAAARTGRWPLGMARHGRRPVPVLRLGAGATFASLMPGFLLFGAGAGLMKCR